jgi:hypothetical protein
MNTLPRKTFRTAIACTAVLAVRGVIFTARVPVAGRAMYSHAQRP